jgi:hypothetical protein
MTRKYVTLLYSAIFFLFIVSGCARHSNKTVGDLVQYFKQSGLQGEYQPMWAVLIGAKEGGSYSGNGFSVEIYLFDDLSKAESLEKSGFSGKPCHRNGKFILLIYEGENKVVPLFKRF